MNKLHEVKQFHIEKDKNYVHLLVFYGGEFE